jgi:hypothetical protein
MICLLVIMIVVAIVLGSVAGYLWGLLTQSADSPGFGATQVWLDALNAAEHIRAAARRTEGAMAVPVPPDPWRPGS